MDRCARLKIVNGRLDRGISALLLLALALLLYGCYRGGRGEAPAPPPREERYAGDNTAPAVMEWLPPAVPTEGPVDATDAREPGDTASDNTGIGVPEAAAPRVSGPFPDVHGEPAAVDGGDSSRVSGPPADNAARPAPLSSADALGGPGAEGGRGASRVSGHTARKPKPAGAPHPVPTPPAKVTPVTPPPEWANGPEELVYRVDFIGITMGYARFRYEGKVSIAGKPAYHLNVRAWTSGVLSYIFPINEIIDYYLDVETLAPIRQEFTKYEKEEDDVALYDQETGRITYRYRKTGKIRKQVDTIPSVYDPVSVAYYFRWRDLGAEDRPRNVYAGRKLYQISSRILGKERIRMERGEVDTVRVLPLIRRDGKPDDKGDLKIWFSSDERRVPVRLYAKFHKIKDWTLVGELLSSAAKAGG